MVVRTAHPTQCLLPVGREYHCLPQGHSMNPPQHLRGDYPHFQPITTRWHDNDIYGHVNNVTY